MLEIRKLEHFYGESRTLWAVDLDIAEGSRACLMGRNGVGKTTLLRCIMGLERLRSGEIRFDGQALHDRRAEDRARLGVAYVPQGREIFPRLSVEENFAVGLGARPGLKAVPPLVYELFPVLMEMRKRRGGDLSGGQQQQLAIGRALVLEPRLLILDEPTEGIQPNVVQEIGDIIVRLNQDLGLTVLLVEQKLPFARQVADSFVILDKGRRVAGGAIEELDDEIVARHLAV